MKVKLHADYKKYYTLDDLARAKAVIANEKEYDEETPAGWITYAVSELYDITGDDTERVITAEARTAKNCRAWNAYGTAIDSQDMDVWIEGLVKTRHGYMEIGAYLSDIWQTGAVKYSEHIYYRYFKECRV